MLRVRSNAVWSVDFILHHKSLVAYIQFDHIHTISTLFVLMFSVEPNECYQLKSAHRVHTYATGARFIHLLLRSKADLRLTLAAEIPYCISMIIYFVTDLCFCFFCTWLVLFFIALALHCFAVHSVGFYTLMIVCILNTSWYTNKKQSEI